MEGPDKQSAGETAIEPLCSVEDVSAVLRISESGVYRLIRKGELNCIKVGNRTLIEPDEIRRFIAAQRIDLGPGSAKNAA